MPVDSRARVLYLGRYAVHDRIASGGMATVHVGRLVGSIGFNRTVAIKRLHPALAAEPELVSMLIDEANLAARIRHPNVVQTLDAVTHEGEVFLVMEYVAGESLASLMRETAKRKEAIPLPIISAIVSGLLHGLHAAHEATSETGEPLGLVHRDVSPQNVLVGGDGVPRLIDFGVAKAVGRIHTTRDGSVKGKVAYMSPEQLRGVVNRRTDIYAAGVVLWELLAGRRLFRGENEAEVMQQVLMSLVDPPSKFDASLPAEVDAVAMRALERDADLRYATAREMALELERLVRPALASEVGDWVEGLASQNLQRRAALIAAIEASKDPAPIPGDGAGPEVSTRETIAAQPVVDADGSQRSIASVTGPRMTTAKPGRYRVVVIAAVLGIVLGGVFSYGRYADRDATPAAAESTVTPSVASPVPPSPSPSSTASPPSPPTAIASPQPEPTATEAPSARPSATARGRGVHPPPRKPVDDDCASPTVVDPATGKVTFKRKCLH